MNPKRIAMLHYAGPPTVGGVEATIAHHARGLAGLGYSVRVISGDGAAFDDRIEVMVNPLFGSQHPAVLAVKSELDTGRVTPAFDQLTAQVHTALAQALTGCEVCIAHNAASFHKNLALSAALRAFCAAEGIRLIAWCHDLAWTNPQYLPELHEGQPWDLIRTLWPGTHYVTVSEARRAELAACFKLEADQVTVVPPGIDIGRFFRWTPVTRMLVERLNLLDADGILLLPARITRRKNIAFGLHILDELRGYTGRDFRLVVSGPPGPHNPTNPGYLGELLDLRHALALENAAHFVYALSSPEAPLVPDEETMADLYNVADGLLFPSTQEGFGIPMLEAGIAGIPIFCADIPPFRQTGQQDALYFDPAGGSPRAIAIQIAGTLERSATARMRVRVRQAYRWESIIQHQIVPLLEAR